VVWPAPARRWTLTSVSIATPFYRTSVAMRALRPPVDDVTPVHVEVAAGVAVVHPERRPGQRAEHPPELEQLPSGVAARVQQGCVQTTVGIVARDDVATVVGAVRSDDAVGRGGHLLERAPMRAAQPHVAALLRNLDRGCRTQRSLRASWARLWAVAVQKLARPVVGVGRG
jgi:hypothetical protein